MSVRRLDTYTQISPPKVGMSYEEWCATYQRADGTLMNSTLMRERVHQRGTRLVMFQESAVAGQGMLGWRAYPAEHTKVRGKGVYFSGWDGKAKITAVRSRKRKEKSV